MCLHVFRFGLPCGNQVKNSVYIWNSNWGKVSPEKFRNMLLFTQKKNLFKRISLKKVTSSIAGAGFEPYDLRVGGYTTNVIIVNVPGCACGRDDGHGFLRKNERFSRCFAGEAVGLG